MKDQLVNRIFLWLLLAWCVGMGCLIWHGLADKPASAHIAPIGIETTVETTAPTETTVPVETEAEETSTPIRLEAGGHVETVDEKICPTGWVGEDTEQPITADTIRTEEFERYWHEPAVYMAKTLWGEARGCSVAEQQKVAWCILNRVDDPKFPNTIIGVIIAPNQFHGYSPNFPCTDELYEVSMDVIAQWQAEKNGGVSDRNLGSDYLYFCADNTGIGNVFRKHW